MKKVGVLYNIPKAELLKYMKKNQFQKIFSGFSIELLHDLEDDFQTCWYGSAGLDTKIFDYFSDLSSESLLDKEVLLKKPIKVYFFTDTDYKFYADKKFNYLDKEYCFEDGICSPFQFETLSRRGELIASLGFVNRYRTKLVRFTINNENIYCFYISIADEVFEKFIIGNKVKIDIACHAGGWAGPGPILLKKLGVLFYLGNFPYDIASKFNVEIMQQVSWGLCGERYNLSCPLYRIIS